METKDRVQELIAKAIARVFPPAGPPPPDALTASDLVRGYPFEAGEIRRVFGGNRWDALPAQELREHPDWWVFFTPAAFAYYIAAYLNLALDYDGADYAGQFLVGVLAHTERSTLSPAGNAQFDALTSEQLDVIRDWHRFLGLAYPEEEETTGAVPGSLIGSRPLTETT